MKLNVVNIPSPGTLGLNTEDAGVAMATEYAKVATNCVVTRDNRLAARQAFTAIAPTTAFTGTVKSVFETINTDGTSEIIFAANNKIYSGYPAYTDITGAGTITDSNWQFALLQNTLFAVQAGHAPKAWRKVANVWTTQTITMPAGPTPPDLTNQQPNVCLAAFGRMWVADGSTNKTTIWISEELNPLNFTTAGAAFLQVGENLLGGDRIVALGSIGNKLLALCTNQILIYEVNPDVTPYLTLSEVVKGVGCIARDSVVNTGTDLLWLANQGVVSFGRLDRNNGQLPVGDVSMNIHSLLQDEIAVTSNFNNVKACWWATEKSYLLLMKDTGKIYVFNLQQKSNAGVVVTKWEDIKTVSSMMFTSTRQLYFGGQNTLFAYRFYGSLTDTYRFSYYSGFLDLGDPSVFKFLKNISFLVKTSGNQPSVIKWAFDYSESYNSSLTLQEGSTGVVSEYNIAEYNNSEYSAGSGLTERRTVANSSGQYLQYGIEADIKGSEFTVYRVELQATAGKSY